MYFVICSSVIIYNKINNIILLSLVIVKGMSSLQYVFSGIPSPVFRRGPGGEVKSAKHIPPLGEGRGGAALFLNKYKLPSFITGVFYG